MAKKDRIFQVCVILAVLNFIFDTIAFVSPSWLESIPEFKSSFVRIGLWVACFDDFVFPEDYVSKTYQGCWYVYYPEYDYIRYWFNPAWFYAVQMLSLVAFICRCVLLLIVGLMSCDVISKEHKKKPFKTTIGMLIFTTCSSIIVLSIMGVKSKNRDWMPRPDQNRLSWGYGFAVMAGFCSIFGLIACIIIYLREHWKEEYENSLRKTTNLPMQLNLPRTIETQGRPQYANIPPPGHKSPGPLSLTMRSEPEPGAGMRPSYPYARSNVSAGPMTMPYQQAPSGHNPYSSVPRYTPAPGAQQSGTPPQRPSVSASASGRDTVV